MIVQIRQRKEKESNKWLLSRSFRGGACREWDDMEEEAKGILKFSEDDEKTG